MYRPNIVKTCFACGRHIVKSHAWENQEHACYSGSRRGAVRMYARISFLDTTCSVMFYFILTGHEAGFENVKWCQG